MKDTAAEVGRRGRVRNQTEWGGRLFGERAAVSKLDVGLLGDCTFTSADTSVCNSASPKL